MSVDYKVKRIGGVDCRAVPGGGWEWDVAGHHYRLMFLGSYLRRDDHIVHEGDHSPVRMVPWSQGYEAGLAAAYADVARRE